jgi:hypothetical protein
MSPILALMSNHNTPLDPVLRVAPTAPASGANSGEWTVRPSYTVLEPDQKQPLCLSDCSSV